MPLPGSLLKTLFSLIVILYHSIAVEISQSILIQRLCIFENVLNSHYPAGGWHSSIFRLKSVVDRFDYRGNKPKHKRDAVNCVAGELLLKILFSWKAALQFAGITKIVFIAFILSQTA